MQDHFVANIVAGIAPNIRAAELRAAMRKKPQNFTAYDYTLRALHIIHALCERYFYEGARLSGKGDGGRSGLCDVSCLGGMLA